MKNVLSTKLLTPGQKTILNDAGIHFQEYEAIKILYQEFQLAPDFDYFIFTSPQRNQPNAVRSAAQHLLITGTGMAMSSSSTIGGQGTE